MIFNFDSIQTVELTVVKEIDGEEVQRRAVFHDDKLQDEFIKMALTTVDALQTTGTLPEMQVSQDYKSRHPCTLPLDDVLADNVRHLPDITAQVDGDALDDPENVSYYFVQFTDDHDQILVGVRRAAQLKGMRNREIMRSWNDGVELIEGTVMAIDKDFDYLIDAETVWILRPRAFMATAQVQAAVLAAAEGNANNISASVEFLDMAGVAQYGQKHPMGARILASIAGREDLNQTDETLLIDACQRSGVQMVQADGKIGPAPGNELRFLKVLDRRRYTVELVPNTVETFEAPIAHRV